VFVAVAIVSLATWEVVAEEYGCVCGGEHVGAIGSLGVDGVVGFVSA
jgi:hypothetical protein